MVLLTYCLRNLDNTDLVWSYIASIMSEDAECLINLGNLQDGYLGVNGIYKT